MMKRLVCIVVLLVALVSVDGDRHRGHGGGHGGGGGGGGGYGGGGRYGGGGGGGGGGGYGGGGGGGGGNNQGLWISGLCANLSLAESFVNQTQQLISNLQANASFTAVLANRPDTIAYIDNATNTALLSSNCTAYFIGLNSARQADWQALQLQQQYQQIVQNAIMQIIQSLFWSNDDQSSGE